MNRGLATVWSAHTHKSCNASETVLIKHNGTIIGKTIFDPTAKQPRAYIEFYGEVSNHLGFGSVINIED
jgi:hypothetical protein